MKITRNDSVKNIFLTIAIFIVTILLSVAVLAVVLLPYSVAHAASETEAIFATVSDLENNPYASAYTAIKLIKGNQEFYIPESYYLTDVTYKFGTYYSVKYCGEEFYFQSEEIPQTVQITFESGVSASPDLRLTLKEDELLIINEKEVSADSTVRFLGYNTTDDTKIFVMATLNGESVFGFADNDIFEDYNVSYHPISQAQRDELLASKLPAEPDDGDIVPNTSLALRIVLIIGIAVPAVIIVILLFKPTKNSSKQLRKQRSRDEFDYDAPRRSRYDERNDAYERGYDRGYNDRSYDNGYDRGYNDRNRDNYNDGYNDRSRGNGYDRNYDDYNR